MAIESMTLSHINSPATIGDFILTFRDTPTSPVLRDPTSPLRQVAICADWTLRIQDSGINRFQFPWTHVTEMEWDIYLAGELYPVRKSATDATSILRSFLNGHFNPADLNGHFLLLAHNSRSGEWHIWTNRFGTFHAYFAQTDKGTAIGTCFTSVASAVSNHRLDSTGISSFFTFGFFLGTRTFLADATIFKPAMHYVFSRDGRLLNEERYWQWSHRPEHTRSFEDTLTDYADVFQNVMSDLMSAGRIALPISGGLDSRSTFCPLLATPENFDRNNIWAFSYGYSDDSIETKIAQQVAATARIPFQAFTIRPYLFQQIDRVAAAVECFQDLTQCRQAFVVDELALHSDYVIAAHWGDVWHDDLGLPKNKNRLSTDEFAEILFKKMAKPGHSWLLNNFTQESDKQGIKNNLLQQLTDELSHYNHIEDLDFRLKAFKTDYWSFRWTLASLRMYMPGAFPRLPFYDNRMVDFFLTVPTRFVGGRRMQIDHIKQIAPMLANIKWQAFDSTLYNYNKFQAINLPKKAWKKAKRILLNQKIIERNWEVQFLAAGARKHLEKWLLDEGTILHDFFPPKAINNLLNELQVKPNRENGFTASMLLTFSVGLNKNLGN